MIQLSQTRTVRIDEKTLVYARLGDDPEEVRQRYKRIMQNNSALKPLAAYLRTRKKRRDL
jgi:hypothetical protein